MANIPETEPQPRLRLTEVRNAREWSQAEVAEMLGTTHVNVSRWERGITRPNPYFRRKLCKLFGKTEEELDLVPTPAPLPTIPFPGATPAASVTSEPSPAPALYDPAIPLQAAIRLVGRDDEVLKIKLRLRTGGNVALTALNGLPGVGKTALSITLAHDPELREHFHDGILWAGLGPSPNIQGLLSRWGTLLGISTSEMAALSGDEARARVLRNTIGSRSMLIVIDDAWKLEDALTFKVGGPNCSHLVTTRFRAIAAHVAIDGATELQELSEVESMTLLRLLAPSVIDREAQKAQTLVQAVGGLPLALTLMGNYLRKQAYSGQTRRITSALERLSRAEERLQISEFHSPVEMHPSLPGEMQLSLYSVIAVTDQLLDEQTRKALYALAVFPPKPNSFSEEAALAIADCTVDILDTLIDTGLLESTGSGRYTLHQTITDYARLQLSDPGPRERLITYALAMVGNNKKNYALLDQEYHISLAALERAHEMDRKRELVQLVTGMMPYFLRGGIYSLAERYLQWAHEAATDLDDTATIIATLLHTGEVVQQQSKFAQAAATFQEGLTLARQTGNNKQISAFLHNLGWVMQRLGNLAQAETYLQEGLAIARQIADKERVCSILKVLGSVTIRSGDYVRAEDYLQEGLTLARQIGDHDQSCLLLLNLGIIAADQGNYTQAEVYYQEGLTLARQSGHRERTTALLTNIGDAVSERGNYEQAEAYFQEGLALARQIEHREWTSVLLINLALVARKRENYNQMEMYLREGLDLAQQIGVPYVTALYLYEYGNFYLNKQQIADAEATFRKILATIPEGSQDLTALAHYGLARVAAARGNLDEAVSLGEASMTSLEAIGHRSAQEVQQWLASLKR